MEMNKKEMKIKSFWKVIFVNRLCTAEHQVEKKSVI